MKAKKLCTKLQATGFCDIGTLTSATNDERVTILALSMYHRLGPFDPSNEYVMDYKNKSILNKYKKISDERPTKTNTLLEIYDFTETLDNRVELLKNKVKYKVKIKIKKTNYINLLITT